MKEGSKPKYPEKTPSDELQKMPHTKARKSKPKRDSNPHNSVGGRLGKQTCKPLHHTSHWFRRCHHRSIITSCFTKPQTSPTHLVPCCRSQQTWEGWQGGWRPQSGRSPPDAGNCPRPWPGPPASVAASRPPAMPGPAAGHTTSYSSYFWLLCTWNTAYYQIMTVIYQIKVRLLTFYWWLWYLYSFQVWWHVMIISYTAVVTESLK